MEEHSSNKVKSEENEGGSANVPVEVDPDFSMSSIVGKIVYMIDNQLSLGDVSQLKRMKWEIPTSSAFWRILSVCVEPTDKISRVEPYRSEDETKWAALISIIAQNRKMYAPKMRLGKALAISEFSELRFAKLMHSHGKHLLHAMRSMGAYLRSKSQPVNWTDVANLLFSEGRDYETEVRSKISRDYYR